VCVQVCVYECVGCASSVYVELYAQPDTDALVAPGTARSGA
jgi:hypothetical protein